MKNFFKKKGFQTINAYNEIKRRIITLELRPGEVIDEKKLMLELKVGRTPVREAILILKNQNLIVSTPNKSAYVKELTLKDARDLSESLMGIEKLVTILAAQRISPDLLQEVKEAEKKLEKAVAEKNYWEIESKNRQFHQIIAKASDNPYLLSIHENLREEISRLSYLAFSKNIGNTFSLLDHLNKIITQHREIIQCLEKKDSYRAGELSEEHIKLFQKRISLYFSNFP
jgi:DNA-binding GntR family transcriptional regulator